MLIGQNDRPVTKHMLRAQGLRLYEIALIADLDTARRQIVEVAAVLGHPERGRNSSPRSRQRARGFKPPRSRLSRTALLVNRGGYTAGAASLAAVLFAEAGLKPPARSAARLWRLRAARTAADAASGHDRAEQPAVEREADQGSYNLSHPALNALYPPQRRIILPPRYTICGGPALVEAFDYLAALLTRLAQSPTMRTN